MQPRRHSRRSRRFSPPLFLGGLDGNDDVELVEGLGIDVVIGV